MGIPHMTALSNTPNDQLTEYAGYHFHDAVSDLVDAMASDGIGLPADYLRFQPTT